MTRGSPRRHWARRRCRPRGGTSGHEQGLGKPLEAWTRFGAFGPVYQQPLDGGAALKLTTENGPYGIAIDAQNVIAIDDTSVYWANPGDGSIMKVTPK
jgi:hypothetical protein